MKIRLLCIVLLLCLTVNIYAEETSSTSTPNAIFVGLGPEVNANTRKGMAIGGVFTGGYEISSQFAVGLKTAYSHNLDTISALEPLAFFRYYLPLVPVGPFLQVEAGSAIYFEHGESHPSFSGGLSAGWRFDFLQDLYVEPALRLGYPHMWGIGVTVGYKFIMN